MSGTDTGTIAFVGAAAIIDTAWVVGLAHGSSTIAAAEEPRKRAYILLKAQGAGIPLQKGLHAFPLIRFNNGLVGPFHDRPLLSGELLCLAVHSLARGFALFHSANIHLIF